MAIARTVTGDVPEEELGVTLPHEHLLIDTTTYIDEKEFGKTVVQQQKLEAEVSLENLWWMGTYGRQWEWRSYDQYRLDDVSEVTTEVQRFRNEGGQTLVDVTPMSPAVGRDPKTVRRIAHETGINVIAGTGHYVEATHPASVDDKTATEIADEIVSDIEDGMDGTDVHAGIIGEIGATEGFHEKGNEAKCFRAAAIAQNRTDAPITVHTTGFSHEAHTLLDVLVDADANVENVILGHLDMTIRNEDSLEYLQSLADRGAYIEFDTFGRIGYLAPHDRCFPLDESRIEKLRTMFDSGYGDQMLISTDICQKTHLTKYGGFGYGYILRDIVPRLKRRDFSRGEINQLLIENPTSAVSFST